MNEDNLLEQDDYYAWLGLNKGATSEEINIAYKKMSRMFHPDKHATDEESQLKAQSIFTKVKKAHAVLSDPHQKAIYDTVGVSGLKNDGWQIIKREKTPAEILQEFERLKEEEENRRLQRKTNPVCDVKVDIDVTDFFDRYRASKASAYGSREGPVVEISSISINTSVDCPLTAEDTVVLEASLNTENGRGEGAITTLYRRVLSDISWAEASVAVGHHPVIGFKGFRRLWTNGTGVLGCALHIGERGIAPILTNTISHQISRHLVGKMTFGFSTRRPTYVQTVLAYSKEEYNVSAILQVTLKGTSLTLKGGYVFQEYDLILKANVKLGTLGQRIQCGCSKKITEFSTISTDLVVDFPDGVKLKLMLIRGNQSFIVPIQLSGEVMLEPILYGTILPLLTYTVIQKLVVNPFLKNKESQDLQRKKEVNAEKMAEKKSEAFAEMDLMAASIERSYKQERDRSGLVITKALYGKLGGDGDASMTLDEDVINVTNQMQALVKDSKILILPGTQLSQLPGFYDPCLDEEKQLAVTYYFRGQLHMCTHKEGVKILIPSREDICNGTSS